ncbi:MAG: NUDIX hydrolase [Dehalococcoidia bacterium]
MAETSERAQPPMFVVNVEAFVWRESDGRYLMLERGASEEIAPGTLVPPGGKLELDDPREDTLARLLRREVLEEAGVEVGDARLAESKVFEGSFDGRPLPILDLVFWCRWVSGEPGAVDPEEVARLEWLSPEEIRGDPRTMAWTRASLELVEAARARG